MQVFRVFPNFLRKFHFCRQYLRTYAKQNKLSRVKQYAKQNELSSVKQDSLFCRHLLPTDFVAILYSFGRQLGSVANS